jgi:colanic acid/amylovoran biosynthesis glycosyltransferase
LVCNCQFLRQRFEKLRRRPQRIDVIYNHPPQRAAAGKIGSLPASPRVSNDTALLLYVGQITEAKGVSLLIEAAMQLIKRGADLALWVVGDDRWGNLRTRLEQQVEERGFYDSIRFLGYRDDVGELFQDAALHVCPSIWEDPSPNVIFEAKLAGVPSVVFPVGGVPELIEDKVDGFVCQESTVESLCEGIMHFVDEAVALEDAGYAARRSLDERFGHVRYCEEWREVFSRCRQLQKCRGNEA